MDTLAHLSEAREPAEGGIENVAELLRSYSLELYSNKHRRALTATSQNLAKRSTFKSNLKKPPPIIASTVNYSLDL